MDWHKRYLQQSNWTRELREYIFREIGLKESSRAIEIGCGTGAILSQIDFPVYGLDFNLVALKEALLHAQADSRPKPPRSKGFSPVLTCGDALSLPYADNSFDVVFCHFLLLWLPNPGDALREMMRVAMPNAHIIIFAEPDYSQRVDMPAELEELGKWQSEALCAQGANPNFGRELAELCFGAGIKIVETGPMLKSTHEASADERANEWDMIEADLTESVPVKEIQKKKKIDQAAWQRGERILYVPTYYLWGRNKV